MLHGMDLDTLRVCSPKPETQKSWWCKLQSKAGRLKTQEEPGFQFKSHDGKTKRTSKAPSVPAEGSPTGGDSLSLAEDQRFVLFRSSTDWRGPPHWGGDSALLFTDPNVSSLRNVLTEIQNKV